MGKRVLLAAVLNDPRDIFQDEVGLGSVAAYLRAHGHDVVLVAGPEEQLDYESLIRFQPQLIGLSVYTSTLASTTRFARRMKAAVPGAKVCAGGFFATYEYHRILAEVELIDFIIRGEGEVAAHELVLALGREDLWPTINGLVYREGATIHVNPDREMLQDLDALPVPSRDPLVQDGLFMAAVSTSRGCTRRCRFCGSPAFWSKWRGRSADHVLAELQELRDQGHRRFNFIDNSFEDPDTRCERLRKIAQGIIDLGLDIWYFASFRTSFYKRADDELMSTLKRSGLLGALLGVEAANPQDLHLYAKGTSTTDNTSSIELFRSYGIDVCLGFININPYSSPAALRDNVAFLEKYGFACYSGYLVNRYRNYRGTDLFDMLERDGLLLESGIDDEYNYRFVDGRVEALALFLGRHMRALNQASDGAVSRLDNYFYHPFVLSYLMARLQGQPNPQVEAAVSSSLSRSGRLLGQINTANARWFRGLLEIAEDGWSESAATAVMGKHFSVAQLADWLDVADREKRDLYTTLMERAPEYAVYLGRG